MELLVEKMNEAVVLRKEYIKLLVEYIVTFTVGLLLFVVGCWYCSVNALHGFKLVMVLFATVLPACWYGSYIPSICRNIRRINEAIAV